MPVIRVVVQVVAPGVSREIPVDVDSALALADLLALLVREYGVSGTTRWAFELFEKPLDPALALREVVGRSGSHPPLFLVLRAGGSAVRGGPGAAGMPASGRAVGGASDRAPGSFAPPPARSPAPAAPPAPADADDDTDLAAESEQAEVALPPPVWRANKRQADEAEAAPRARSKAKMSSGATPRRETSRRATVRYYSRMNPDRMFPLLVILSKEEVAEIVKAKVRQAQSEAFQVEEGSVVEVEPVLPGCDCYPPRHALTVDADGATSATIWVVPRVLGRVHGARVLIRQGAKVLAEVPLDVKVAKQTLAVACGLLSLAAPYMTMGLKSLKLDYESQKADGFPLYQQAGGWVAENLRPEWLGLGFLGLAFVLYLWMRPRRRDVFWDVAPRA